MAGTGGRTAKRAAGSECRLGLLDWVALPTSGDDIACNFIMPWTHIMDLRSMNCVVIGSINDFDVHVWREGVCGGIAPRCCIDPADDHRSAGEQLCNRGQVFRRQQCCLRCRVGVGIHVGPPILSPVKQGSLSRLDHIIPTHACQDG